MTIFPNAKINFGLRITSKRSDGFHDIQTIYYPVGVHDALEFVTEYDGNDSDAFTQTGLETHCRMADNLVIKALTLLREKHNIPSLNIHLHKAIPIGAGLGGGSADAVFMLRYLCKYFELGLSDDELSSLSLKLGSDCPFFIENRPAFAEGRGDILEKIDDFLNGFHIILINPGIHISTSEAYSLSTPTKPSMKLSEIVKSSPEKWKELIINDFEQVIFDKHPEIARIKTELYELGALFSSMSGSGSSVYGIFEDKSPVDKLTSDYWKWCGTL
jgi:4-diphosphocytidyl-2-C-methyl-D-erythritol kinase